MPPKPTSVIVLSIIGIVLATLNILGTVALLIVQFAHILPTAPLTVALERDVVYMIIKASSATVGMVNNVLLLVCSIASLRLIRWARKGMLAYAWIALVHLVLGLVIQSVFVFPRMLSTTVTGGSAAAVHAGVVGGILGGMCGVFLYAIFPICIIRFYTRKKVVDAFNGILPPAQSNFQVILPGGESR